MKRSKKVLLLTGLAAITIGAAGILHINHIQMPESNKSEIKAYNYRPANILDNLFEKDNVTYLPFIFESSDETVTKDKIETEFNRKGLTITNVSTGNKIATGTQITVRENSNVYTIVIYGDVDGDGEITVFDAQECVDDFVNDGNNLSGAYKIAANVENDTEDVDVFDAQKIVDFYVGIEKKLVLREPTTGSDNTVPVISIDGQPVTDTATIKIKVGDTEPLITANDDVDGDITASIVRTGDIVNTNSVGTYTTTYTVADSHGNTTTVTIVVIVERNSGGGSTTTTPKLTNIEIASETPIYLEENSDKTITQSGLIYTIVPIKLIGQRVNELSKSTIDSSIKVETNIEVLGKGNSKDVIVKDYFDTDHDNRIDAIGFAVSNNNLKLTTKGNITLKVGNYTHNVESTIMYKNNNAISAITFKDSEDAECANKGYAGIIDQNYIVRKCTEANKEINGTFTLGEIRTSTIGERPIEVKDMEEINEENLSIWYEYNENGDLLVKGTLKDASVPYTINLKTKITNIPEVEKEIIIQAIDVQGKININLTKMDNTSGASISISKNKNERLVLNISDEVSTDLGILSKYITISENEHISIARQKPGNRPMGATDNDVLKYLAITTSSDKQEEPIEVSITLFKGCGQDLETPASFEVTITE